MHVSMYVNAAPSGPIRARHALAAARVAEGRQRQIQRRQRPRRALVGRLGCQAIHNDDTRTRQFWNLEVKKKNEGRKEGRKETEETKQHVSLTFYKE